MDEKSLIEEVGKKTADQIKQALDAAKSGDQERATALEAKLLNQLGPDSEHMKAMQTQLDTIATDLKKQANAQEQVKSIGNFLTEVGRTAEFKNLRSSGGKFVKELPIDFGMKSVLNSAMTGVLPKPSWIPGVFRAPDQQPFISQLVPVVPTNSDVVYYVNRVSRTNNTAAQTEGSALGENSYNWGQASASVSDIGNFTKVSDQALADNADWIMAELAAEIPWAVLNAQDAAILTAILAGDTAFSAAGKPYLSNVVDANEFDVLRAAINQARAANFAPDAVLVNNDDYAMMEMVKDLQGQYVVPQFYSSAGLRVSNVPIIPNNTITSGTYEVCSFSRSRLAMRQNLVMEFGYDAADFSTRMITVRAYVRSAFILSTQMAGGFIGGTFATDKATINKV